MKTEKIVVSSNGRGMTMALDEVEAFSRAMGFDERSSMRARLLAEETMSMVRAIVEDLNTSTHKRNEASVGIMGKIKDFIEGSLFYLGSGSNRPVGDYHMVGCVSYEEIQLWSLEQYRLCLEKDREEGADVDALFDELEKSIVANIADDVRVSVQDDNIEMIIRKNFPIDKL